MQNMVNAIQCDSMSHNEIIWEEPALTDYYIDGQKLSP